MYLDQGGNFDRGVNFCYNVVGRKLMENKDEIIEEWRDVHGYEGYYQVSNLGRVKGLSRPVKSSRPHTTNEHILKEGDCRGYKRVTLSIDAKHKTFIVHRLVASAFIPNPNNYPQINHKDGNKANNIVSNLEWCDASQNNYHKFNVLGYKVTQETKDKISSKFKGRKWSEEYKRNLSKILRGIKKPTLCKKVRCKNTGEIFNSIQEAASAKEVFASNITLCCQGKIKQIKGWEWEFIDE